MADVLKTLPFLTVDDYLWKYSSPFIRLMAYDQSRIRYRKDRKADTAAKVFKAEDIFRSLGYDDPTRKEDGTQKASVGSWMDNIRNRDKKQENNQKS